MGTKNQTSTTTQKLPGYLEDAYKKLVESAGQTASTGYTPYTGGFTPDQQQAFENIRSMWGTSDPAFNASMGAFNTSMVPTSQSVNQYMSPYMDQVISAAMGNMQEQNAQQQQQVVGNAIMKGALGGNRVGVAQAELGRQQKLADNAALANLYNQGYTTALGAAQADKTAALQAAQGYAGLGQTQMQTGLAQAASQLGAGTQQQEFDYSQYLNELAFPYQQQSWLASLVGGLGSTAGGTTTEKTPSGNIFSQVLGTGLQVAGLFSDERVKEDSRPVGKTFDGQTIYSYRYKGQPETHMGLMAQEVREKHPEAVGRSSGLLTVDYDAATRDAAKRGEFSRGGLVGYAVGGVPYANNNSRFGGYMSGSGLMPYVNDNDRWSSYIPTPVAMGGGGNRIPQPRPRQEQEDPLANPNALMKKGASNIAGLFKPNAASVRMPALYAEGGVVGRRGYAAGGIPMFDPYGYGALGLMPARREEMIPEVPTGIAPTIESLEMPAEVVAPLPKPEPLSIDERGGTKPQPFSHDLFGRTEEARGLPPGYLSRTAQIESNYNPAARNDSGATGLFQFMPDTARDIGLGNALDPAASTVAAAELASRNADILRKGLGREPTAAELYLAHQQGGAGAVQLLANPGAPAVEIVGRGAVVQNGGDPNMSAGQFAQMWMNKFNGAKGERGFGEIGPSIGNQVGDVPYGTGDQFVTRPQGGGYSKNIGEAWKSLMAGNGLNFAPDVNQGLMAAGAAMASSKSPWFLAGVGEGTTAGINAWREYQAMERENALARAQIGQRGEELANTAFRTAADVDLTRSQAERTDVETQTSRYDYRYTPYGVQVTDKTTGAPGMIYPYGSMMPDGNIAERPADAPLFEESVPARGPLDARMMSEQGAAQAVQQGSAAISAAQEENRGATGTQQLLQEMKHNLAQLPEEGIMTPGKDFKERADLAKGVNTYLQVFGLDPFFPEGEIAAAEDLNKLTNRLGFDLSRMLGSNEAASVVMTGIESVPGGANSKKGAQRIIAGLEAANRRRIDYYEKVQQWAANNGGSILGFDEWFNRVSPPELYALSSYVPVEAMEFLRANPNYAGAFNQKYGDGKDIARFVLGR